MQCDPLFSLTCRGAMVQDQGLTATCAASATTMLTLSAVGLQSVRGMVAAACRATQPP